MNNTDKIIKTLIEGYKNIRDTPINNDKIEKIIYEAIMELNIIELSVLERVLKIVLFSYYGDIVLGYQYSKVEFYDIFVKHLDLLKTVYQEERIKNPINPFKTGRLLSMMMNIIEADNRLYFGKTRSGNFTIFLGGHGSITLKCRNTKEMLDYYKIFGRPILHEIAKLNIIHKIPYSQRENYISGIQRAFPLANLVLIQQLYERWGNEVGIETSPTGLIEDSQLWAKFTSLGDQKRTMERETLNRLQSE